VALVTTASCGARAPVRSSTRAVDPRDRPIAAQQVWERVKRELVGTWRATPEGSDGAITISFRLVSADSAIVETYVTPSGRETITVFHPDGDGLVLTHYCAQGNQPRLRVVSDRDGIVVFRHFDATNLRPDQAVLVERTLRLDGDRLDLTDTYRQPDGTMETSVMQASRVTASSSTPAQ
jgi:hypothetical protein